MSTETLLNRCAVIGNPIAHSLSPQIHQQFAVKFDMTIDYQRIVATEDNFTEIVQRFFAAGGRGLNITAPFKQRAFSLCDHTCSMSEAAQSCNTLYMSEGKLVGTTTDGGGWLDDIQRLGFDFNDKSILLLGAGGANRILYHTLLEKMDLLQPKAIVWANRSIERLDDQPNHPVVTKVALNEIPDTRFDLIINGISVGLHSEFPSLAVTLDSGTLIYDLNYGPGAKAFHRWASNCGASADNCIDGWGMLVNQAARSFAIWWGKSPATATLIKQGINL